MQYDRTNAYRDGRLIPAPLDRELARDALANIELPDLLYQQRRYRLPVEVRPSGRPG